MRKVSHATVRMTSIHDYIAEAFTSSSAEVSTNLAPSHPNLDFVTIASVISIILTFVAAHIYLRYCRARNTRLSDQIDLKITIEQARFRQHRKLKIAAGTMAKVTVLSKGMQQIPKELTGLREGDLILLSFPCRDIHMERRLTGPSADDEDYGTNIETVSGDEMDRCGEEDGDDGERHDGHSSAVDGQEQTIVGADGSGAEHIEDIDKEDSPHHIDSSTQTKENNDARYPSRYVDATTQTRDDLAYIQGHLITLSTASPATNSGNGNDSVLDCTEELSEDAIYDQDAEDSPAFEFHGQASVHIEQNEQIANDYDKNSDEDEEEQDPDNYDGDSQSTYNACPQSSDQTRDECAGDAEDLTPRLLCVTGIEKDEEDNITDIDVVILDYQLQCPAGPNGFHLYGDVIECTTGTPDVTSVVRMTDIINGRDECVLEVVLHCTGNDVREKTFGGLCPAHCDDGWLYNPGDLENVVEETVPEVDYYRPVCPVCVGKDLSDEHRGLITRLQRFGFVDLTTVLDFFSRLNPRRESLGYSFRQLDEREWGYQFDDMQDDDDDDDQDSELESEDGWQQASEEAMDASAGASYHPASRAARNSLTQTIYFRHERKEDGGTESCAICGDEFLLGETRVIELPCGHKYCADSCILPWLKTSNSCPECRTKIPEVEDGESEDSEESEDGEEQEQEVESNGAAVDRTITEDDHGIESVSFDGPRLRETDSNAQPPYHVDIGW